MYYVCDNKLMPLYEPEEIAATVKNTINYYKERAEELEKENKEWRERALEKANQELIDEIQALQEQLSLSYLSFASPKEKDAYNDFEQHHMHNRIESKHNSGRAPYIIPYHTGFSTILKVKCPICDEVKDITDTEVW